MHMVPHCMWSAELLPVNIVVFPTSCKKDADLSPMIINNSYTTGTGQQHAK